MEPKTLSPTFTVSLRGYDRMEVDEYLESLSDALGQVEHSREHARQLQAVIGKLKGRIIELEERINSDTPRTGAVLGERIGLLLRQAEDTAADTIRRGEDRAAELIADSNRKLADAEDEAAAMIARAEEQARRLDAAAKSEADEIIAEAERRATGRARDIEQWADQVISRTRADEARMRHDQDLERHRAMADLRDLAARRDAVAATLAELREALGNALGLVVGSPNAPDSPVAAEATVATNPIDSTVAFDSTPSPAPQGSPSSDSSPDAPGSTNLDDALSNTAGYTSNAHTIATPHGMPCAAPAPPDIDSDVDLELELELGGPHLSLIEGGFTPAHLYDAEADDDLASLDAPSHDDTLHADFADNAGSAKTTKATRAARSEPAPSKGR